MIARTLTFSLLAFGVLAFTGCGDDDAPRMPTAVASATGTVSRATPIATASEPPTPGPSRVAVTGVFTGAPPQGSQPVAISDALETRPRSPFPDWDGKQSMIYDVKSGVAIDTGTTSRVVFSPDSSLAAWISGSSSGAAVVLNLDTGARRTYKEGTNVGFLDDRRLAVFQSQTTTWLVLDLTTGEQSADQSIPPDQASQPGYPSYPPSPTGYYWQIAPEKSTQLPRGGYGKSSFKLIQIASGATALQFDAVFAAPAGPGEVVIATPLEQDMTNVFVINIRTGSSEFVARVRYGNGPNWPLSATTRYVLWTENFCWSDANPIQGDIQIYDRAAKTLTNIDDGGEQSEGRYALLTPDGLIALGSFGASALIDPATLGYTVVLPGGVHPSFRNWSPNYRYAAYSVGGGHGGLC